MWNKLLHRPIPKGRTIHSVFISTLFCLMVFLSSFAATCEGGDPLPSDIDSSLVSQLQAEYQTYGASTTPPFNAFTNYENSAHYSFWDEGHINWEYGWALNTSDAQYSGIAIIRYYVKMDDKADEVIHYLEQIDPNFLITAISSAYRNPARNYSKGGSTNSYHIYGRAIDFDILYGLQEAQNVWDAILYTNSVTLLNGAEGRDYLYTRPSGSDVIPTGWIHVAW